jgi:hypothetical protein
MRQLVIRYEVRPERAEENEALVAAVYEELARTRPDGLRYVTFRSADGVSFVHVAQTDGDVNPLDGIAAFAQFQQDIGERLVAPPVVTEVRTVGSYRVFE